MNRVEISVIVCTHNPDVERLQRVIAALKGQILDRSQWEIVVVDNASSNPIAGRIDLEWHGYGRIVREERIGLTWARLRGLAETTGSILVYVDDDNVLAPDYLDVVTRLATAWPQLGVWGGEILPDYEEVPANELKPFTGLLALLEVKRDIWCNFRNANCIPRGAGLVVRRDVAIAYKIRTQGNQLRHLLERQGESLASCGDSDLCFTATDLGFGLGVFKDLKLIHIIPKERVRKEYLLRLEDSMSYSWTILNFLYDGNAAIAPRNVLRQCLDFFRALMLKGVAKEFQRASSRGRRRALSQLKAISSAL